MKTTSLFDNKLQRIFLGGAVLAVLILAAVGSPVQAVRELSGDEIEITALEDDEYIFEARGNANLLLDELEVTGERAEFHSLEEEVQFFDEVTVLGPDLTISASELLYQLAGETVFLTGRPQVQYQDLDASSDEVEYYLADEMIYMLGNVEGKRGNQEFSANEVEINLAENNIQLKGQARMQLPEGDVE